MVGSRIHTLAYLPGSLAVVAAGLVLDLVLHRLVGLSRDASAWVTAAFALRLLCALHPAFPSIDASFHAHNLWSYQGSGAAKAHVGTAAGPVEIPYPPLLYAVLSPLATRDVSGETLVRVTVAVLEGTAPLAVFALLLAGGASRRAASLGAAALAVMPEGLLVVAKGIGANSLGGWVALWALVAVLRRGSPVVTACVLALAFLGHPGSAAALVGLLVLWMTWTAWSDPDSRRGLARTALATAAGAVLAWLAYYRQAFTVTVKGLGRFGAEIAGGASFVDRQWPVAKAHALKIAQNLLLKFGGGPVVLAWAGLRRADAPRTLRTLLPPWFVGAGVLALLAVLTPFALRFEHFLAPGMAAAAGLGAEAWEQRGRHGLVSSLIAVSFALQLAIGVLLLLDRFTLISVIIPSPNWSWPFRL
jgi:hypothetical protein